MNKKLIIKIPQPVQDITQIDNQSIKLKVTNHNTLLVSKSFDLEPDVILKLKRLSKQNNCTESFFLNEIIKNLVLEKK